ncbi:MAG: ankyrin repeat domain-containing protein [Acidobacteriota bacterium]
MKMHILLFAALAVLMPSPITEVRSEIARTEDSVSKLRLTMSVVSQRYCKGRDSEVYPLQLEVDLRYENTGKTNLVFYKLARDVIGQRVALSLADSTAKKFILNASLTVLTSPPSMGGTLLTRDDFVVLSPGASFRVRTETVLLLKTPNQSVEGALGPGEYFLQVDVATSPGAKAVPESLLSEWAGIAELWSATIRSEPMRLIVEAVQPEDDCSLFAELLRRARSNPNATDQSGNTALMAALFDAEDDLFITLLTEGANVSARSANGYTAMIVAAGHSSPDAVQELVRRGAHVNDRADDGQTALLEAVRRCDADIVKILSDAGADPNITDLNGRSPLRLAESCPSDDRTQIIKLLKRATAKRR